MRLTLAVIALVAGSALPALAYDGTKCKAPGNCWEPKPGFPEKVAGTKYDPKHDPKESCDLLSSFSLHSTARDTRTHSAR